MKKKVVVFGGGTGLSCLLSGLKDFPIDITAVITVSDNGRSTGKLREEFSMPAMGDIRKVLTNLSELPENIKSIMEYRFDTYSDLDGHPLGNLVLAAFYNKNKNFKESIEYLSKLLDVKHKVLPLSEDYLTLMGETETGRIIEGEDDLPKSKEKYKRIFYKEEPHVTQEVLEEIRKADLIVLSMGSLITSILPHLLCKEVVKEINNSNAKVMYLCNAVTQPGETDNFGVSDHLKLLEKYLGSGNVDVVIASNSKIDESILNKYLKEETKTQVYIDKNKVEEMNIELIESDLIMIIDGMIRHNSLKLSSVIFSYLMR